MRTPEELKSIVEEELERLELWPALHGQRESARYGLVEMGGKRIRPVITLAVGMSLGGTIEQLMPAALAIELVHNFSLVHDDLPPLDNDELRVRFSADLDEMAQMVQGALGLFKDLNDQ